MAMYMIIYEVDSYATIEAEGIKDCIIKFAEYTGDKTQLFEIALQGCNTVKECVSMYEEFSGNRIENIYAISDTIYKEQGGE